MNYREAINYLNSETTSGIEPDLSRIICLADFFGNPQEAYHSIHITGTNGKTSTTRIISAILSSLGLRVGHYTSPHLVSYTERMVVDQNNIEEKEFADLVTRIAPLIIRTNKRCPGEVTQFEALTAMAFSYFADQRIDCAIVEVGMGGSWDATNIICSDVAVITNIALEHTDRLGETVYEIASEKVDIIKKGSSAVTSVTQKSILEMIDEKCRILDTPLYIRGRDFDITSHHKQNDGSQLIDLDGLSCPYGKIKIPLLGEYQAANTAQAVVAVESYLMKRNKDLLRNIPGALQQALKNITSPGRLDVIRKDPWLVLDGAHNPASANELVKALKANFNYDRLVLVLAVLKDKDLAGIVEPLMTVADTVIITQNKSDRACQADLLADVVRSYDKGPIVSQVFSSALERAGEMASSDDLILITGSLYTVGEALEYFNSDKEEMK